MSKKNRHRPILIDENRAKMWREAWDLLLTDRYTLDDICEELHARGYTRSSGKPWVEVSPKTGNRKRHISRLHATFHNPFYAGWVDAHSFNIPRGSIRGNWEPIVSDSEFDEGVTILRRRDGNRQRLQRTIYLLTGILYVKAGKRQIKVSGSRPKGNLYHYTYYVTMKPVNGSKLRYNSTIIDDRVMAVVRELHIRDSDLNTIRALYNEQIRQREGPTLEERITEYKRRLDGLKDEEERLGRLYTQQRITDATYDELRQEWQEKVAMTRAQIARLQADSERLIDDLDRALLLLAHVGNLARRLEPTDKRKLLHALIERVLIDTDGNLLEVRLHAPFAYIKATEASIPSEERPLHEALLDQLGLAGSEREMQRYIEDHRAQQPWVFEPPE